MTQSENLRQATDAAVDHIRELRVQLGEAKERISCLEEQNKKLQKDRLEARLQAHWDKTACL
jgi:hypothetical protein